jgi:two-component system, OmpR family, phosphate regulon sensor histidine kinase PhoR
MRSNTLKWMTLLLTLLVSAIMLVQLYWIFKVYHYEQQEFNTNVVKSIRGVCEDMELDDNPGTQIQKLIETPNENTFIIQVDTIPQRDSLIYFITNEFDDFNVFTDCKMAIYNDSTREYLYQVYLPSAASTINAVGSGNHPRFTEIDLPKYNKKFPFIQLYFPHRQQYIIHQLNFWIVTSVLLLLTLIGFAASIFYFYRQKFLNELQKDFVNNFTHEFKTPLAVMKLAAGVLNSPPITEQPERLKKYSNIIAQQTEHLQLQVEKLLKTARTDQHELPLEKASFNPNNIIKDVVKDMDPLVRQTNTRIEIIEEVKDKEIFADESNIAMVIVNLVENAIKYARDPHVIISTSLENNHYIISVKDNGIGIEKKYIKQLFKKFFRVPTGNVHNVKGFGLGLNFVKKVIDAHKGKIVVNSIPGIGTEFKISLPFQ